MRRTISRQRPRSRIAQLRVHAEMPQHFAVEARLVVLQGHLVDGRGVERGDDRVLADVAEQPDLAARGGRHLAVAAAEQDRGLDADGLQLLDGVLRRLGLELSRRRDPGQQREVHEERALAAELVAELADRLEEGKALDVADRATDLAEQEVGVVEVGDHELLDRVGDVRDHLHGRAEIVAAALLRDHVRVDAPGGDVVALPRRHAREALVVPEVEVGLGAIVGDVDLAVLVGRHRPGIDVQVGIELAQADLEAARLEERAERRGGKALAERGDHAAGYEDEPRHGSPT
jgi:hypothetical protein